MMNDPKIPETPVEEPQRTPDEFVPDSGDVDFPAGIPNDDPAPDPGELV